MPRVTHFEINADDPERAIKFYKNVFGWDIKKWKGPMEYWLVMTGTEGPGIDGAIMRREQPLSGGPDVIAYICTIDVPSCGEYLKKVLTRGGQSITPKTAVPGVGWFAYCKDTEGNVFGIMQEDPAAK